MNHSPNDRKEHYMGRWLRLAVITNIYKQGIISQAEALELLSGRLSPDDPNSVVDDSGLLDKSAEEVAKVLGKLTVVEIPDEPKC